MAPDKDFNLGRHEALIEQLVEGQREIVARVSSMEHLLSEKKGERRVAVWAVGAIGGSIGAILAAAGKLALLVAGAHR